MRHPYIIVIAGPNGVGKSTFARWYLEFYPECSEIVDPDAIARTIMGLPEREQQLQAGKTAIRRIEQLIVERTSFAIESTLLGRTLALRLRLASDTGYYIAICFIWVGSVTTTMQRVNQRVREGGHNISTEDQSRRFDRSFDNFQTIYKEVCHEWHIYRGLEEPPEKVAAGSGDLAET